MAPTDGNQQDKAGPSASRASNRGPAAGKPPMGTETAKNPPAPVTLEPIENYKGKSVEELEAILDAYNAQKPTVVRHEAADEGANQTGDQGQGQAAPPKRHRSQALAKGEESKAPEPLKNSQARRQSGVRRESRGQPGAPGTRPPMIPSGRAQDKENIKDPQRRDYGKVPKYL